MKLVYPWDQSNFVGSQEQRDKIYFNLQRMHFPIQKYKDPPEERIRLAAEHVVMKALEKKWQLVCSNSVALLQAIAELAPIVFSLTTHESSVLVTTEKLVARIINKEDDIKQSDDVLWQVTFAGLLCWFNIAEPHETGDRYHSRFADALTRRKHALGYPAIFLASFVPGEGKKFDESSIASIHDKIRVAVGNTAGILVQEEAVVQFLEVELKPSELINIKI